MNLTVLPASKQPELANAFESELLTLYRGWIAGSSAHERRMQWDDYFSRPFGAQGVEPTAKLQAEFDAIEFHGHWLGAVPERHDSAKQTILFYLHGGGFQVGSHRSHGPLIRHLRKEIESQSNVACAAFCLQYSLSPERYPVQTQQTLAAYRYLHLAYPNANLVVAGDSAGATLALSLVLDLIEQQALAARVRPNAVLLFSAWTDLACEGTSYESEAEQDRLVSRKSVQALTRGYLGAAFSAADFPKASPLRRLRLLPAEGHSQLAPILFQVGNQECILSDSIAFASEVNERGTGLSKPLVEVQRFDGMFHVFQQFAGRLDMADLALRRAASFASQFLK